MDWESLAIGGVQVLVLVIGWVEAAKRFGVEGKASFGLALGLGFAFVALTAAIDAGVIPAGAVVYVEIGIKGLGGALAATGVYDLIKRTMGEREPS